MEVCSKLLVGRCSSALLLPIRGRAEAFFHFVRMSKNNHQHHQEPWTLTILESMDIDRNIGIAWQNERDMDILTY